TVKSKRSHWSRNSTGKLQYRIYKVLYRDMRTAKMISGKCILLACLIFDLWLSSISAD
ncbi:hypothetical protein NDU88_002634, partial [Pleurodeles waltl]